MKSLNFIHRDQNDEYNVNLGPIPIIDWFIPVKTVSEMNVTGHWSLRHKRFKEQKQRILSRWLEDRVKIPTPCHVLLIRVAPRMLDDDNLRPSLKACRDIIADIIIPGKAAGFADSSLLISWEYQQEKRLAKQYGLHVRIYEMPIM